MNERPKRNLVGSLLPLSLSSLLLIVLLCGLSLAAEAEPIVSPAAARREANHPTSLDYQTGVSVCAQTQNLVPNPGFEWSDGTPDHWYEEGPCTFSYDDPGFDSDRSARIVGTSWVTNCKLRTQTDGILLQPRPYDYSSYDYSARVKANLVEGDAYLRIRFWSWQDDPPGWKSEGVADTEHVTDTDGDWITVTGSVTVPVDAQSARVEATLTNPSAGSVWFDDVYLGLATCLEIEKSDDPDPVAPGGELTYTIVYSNTGREEATNVLIKETYDWQYVYPIDDNGVVWSIPRLPAGTSGTIIAKTRVQTDTGGRAWLFNTVQITSEETIRLVEDTTIDTISTSLDGPDGCAIYVDLRSVERTAGLGCTVDYRGDLRNAGFCAGDFAKPVAISSQGWDVDITPKLWPRHVLSGASIPITVSLSIPTNVPDARVDTTIITATLNCGPPCNKTATATAMVTTTIGVSPTAVEIGGPETGHVDTAYTFIATVSPPTATDPICTWFPPPMAGQGSTIVTYTWSTTGTKTMTVTATNAGGTAVGFHSISIGWYKVYLPLALRNWPPIPKLYPIDNADIDGDYDVCWSAAAPPGYHYLLEESTNSACTGATPVYTGTDTCYCFTDRDAGWYYYHVRVCDSSRCFSPSNCGGVGAWWEREPNNDCSQANGPIRSGSTYSGTFTNTADARDYFSFELSDTPRSVELWLTNIPPGCDYDVALCDADCEVVDDCYSNEYGNADEHVRCNLSQTGTYKVRVYYYVAGCSEPYHLRVVYQ